MDWLHLLCCRDSLTENKLTKNIWSRKKKKKKDGRERKKFTNTTTCQEQNASNFSVIWQPFNKTRSLCPHTPSPSRERGRWRWREAGRLRAKRQTEHQMGLFLISDLNSLNLAFSLQVVSSLSSCLIVPSLFLLSQWEDIVYVEEAG